MNINYLKIEEELNSYAIEAIYDIMEKCGKFMTQEEFEAYEKGILENKVIIVNRPSVDDDKFFKGNVPVAHGPRTKKDGYVHVYPYRYKNQNTDQIIDNYINGSIILHELYHYIIRLDIKNSNEKTRIRFGHYITEGMVELFTELHNKQKATRWSARRNVDAAEKIYNILLDKSDIKLIFQCNIEEIFSKYPELEIIYEDYLKECKFVEGLTNILESLREHASIDTKRIIARFNRYSLLEGIENIKLESENFLDEVDANYFNKQIDELYTSIYEDKEKRLS